MSELLIGGLVVGGLFVLVLLGSPIAFSLIAMTCVGMILLTDFSITEALLAQAAHAALSDVIYAVIPLFILMGTFMTNSRAASDLYALMHFVVRRVMGGLAVATVMANAAFASVTGVSVASATIFSKIAYPQMRKHGYDDRLAVGTIAGSSILGMLIPPSALLILYGLLAQVSIGSLFLAGIVPGLFLAFLLAFSIIVRAYRNPALVGLGPSDSKATITSELEPDDSMTVSSGFKLILRSGPIGILFVVVIGGIWGGLFTPTEAAAVGALGAMGVGWMSGLTFPRFIRSFKEAAIASASILILLIAGQLYTRMLALSGVVDWLGSQVVSLAAPALLIVILFVLILLMLGAILDSTSIILLTVPLFLPVVHLLGLDPVWFGIVMVVAIEIGLITPPFGMVVFAMSSVLGKEVSVERIFAGSLPFVGVLLGFVAILVAFPWLSTWLPGLMH